MSPDNSEQTELLRAIWNEMKALGVNLGGRLEALRTELGAEIAKTNERLDRTNEQLERLQTETRAGFQLLENRFDNLLLGEHGQEHADLRERVTRLEQQLARGGG